MKHKNFYRLMRAQAMHIPKQPRHVATTGSADNLLGNVTLPGIVWELVKTVTDLANESQPPGLSAAGGNTSPDCFFRGNRMPNTVRE